MNIRGLYQTNKVKFIFIIVLILGEEISKTLFSYFLTPAFNFLKDMNFNLFVFFIILASICDFLRVWFSAGVNYVYAKQVQSYFHVIREKISKYIFVHNEEKVASSQNKLNGNITQFNNKYALPLLKMGENILAVLFSVGVLFTFNWSLVLLTAFLSVVTLLLPKIFEKATSAATFNVTKKNEQLLSTIEKWTQGLDELRRYASLGTYQKAISFANQDLKKATIRDCYIGMWANLVASIFSLSGQIALIVLATYLFFIGEIPFGAVITAGNFAGTIMNGIGVITESLNQMKSTRTLNKQMVKMQQPVSFREKSQSHRTLNQIIGTGLSIKFKNGEEITYPDFKINQGDKVLLTGDSGTGKSTLFKIILGELTPKSGKVSFKDQAGNEVKDALDEIGYVAQDNILFPDTIQNNITMFDHQLDGQVKYFAKQTDLLKDLQAFPNGLDTIVDLDKGNLSGGQRQKVVLARAQIHHAPFLFIDEGTSAIDSQSTKDILQNLLDYNQTVVMIAHNFSKELINMFDYHINLSTDKEAS